MKNTDTNLFGSTRWKLDRIAGLFIFCILLIFSLAIYRLLTIDLIYQITGGLAINNDENILFENFKQQTIFLLTLADIVVFIFSLYLFDRLVQRLLRPIEYLSNVQRKFAENLSHELRTPLSIMNMHSEILLNKIEKNPTPNPSQWEGRNALDIESLRSGVKIIQKEIFDITNLIDDLLFEARIKYSEEKIDSISLKDLPAILTGLVNNLQHLKQEQVIFILENNIDNQEQNNFFQINRLHLERILNNLISNSFKFTEVGTVKIILETYRKNQNQNLRIIIEDTGLGIKKEDLSQVGHRFFRGENIEKQISGTGIGLAIVMDIIKKYNWHFAIDSQENMGTRIVVGGISCLEH